MNHIKNLLIGIAMGLIAGIVLALPLIDPVTRILLELNL